MKELLAHIKKRLALLDEVSSTISKYADLAIVVKDQKGIVVQANNHYCELAGLKREELLGQLGDAVCPVDYESDPKEMLAQEGHFAFSELEDGSESAFIVMLFQGKRTVVKYQTVSLGEKDGESMTVYLMEPVVQ